MVNNYSTHCTRCQSPTKPGARFCSKCGQPLQAVPPPPRPEPKQNPPTPEQSQVRLRIVMPVTWHLTDTALDIFVDGQYVGRGSVNEGVDLNTATTPGSHVLEIGADVMAVGGTPLSSFSTRQFRKTWRLPIGVAGPGERMARLKYSRAWGNFKVEVVQC